MNLAFSSLASFIFFYFATKYYWPSGQISLSDWSTGSEVYSTP